MKFISNRDIAVGVINLEKAREFYEHTLSFTPIKINDTTVIYNTGHITLYITKGESYPPVPSFTVQSLQEAKKHLQEHGCTILNERENSFYFQSPDGTIYDVIQPI